MKTSPSNKSRSSSPNQVFDEELLAMLRHLRLTRLATKWDDVIEEARKQRWSPERLLTHVIQQEYEAKRENARLLRRQRANIPEMLEIETYPFHKQPKLNRQRVMSLYDGFDYVTRQKSLVWMGPTGCGKTGLAISFLLQAIDRGYRGYFIPFSDLVQELFQSLADCSDRKVMKRYLSYDCLVIDEVGYVEVEPTQVGQFFTLMQKRHKTKATIITSNLGFGEWGSFLKNPHLTLALSDRITSHGEVINMKECRSLRGLDSDK